MKFHPLIASLRSDRGPQRASQAAMVAVCDGWRGEPGVAAALAELVAFGRGAALEACPQLEAMFCEQGEAERIGATLSRHFARSLRHTPLGHPPLRHGFDGVGSTLLLARSGQAQLLLGASEPGHHGTDHVSFSDALRYEAVLAGEAHATIVRRWEPAGSDAQLHEERVALAPGARLAFDCRSEAMLVEDVSRRYVSLRLHRVAAEPEPTSEYERATGRLIQRSSGDLATSRREMMVALLGRMRRPEAAPLLAEIAREPGPLSLRWQSLRECLALDTATGFAALSTLAGSLDDPLAAEAGAVRAQLIETYPQLRQLEDRPCPA